jgi:hypothetical protein
MAAILSKLRAIGAAIRCERALPASEGIPIGLDNLIIPPTKANLMIRTPERYGIKDQHSGYH